jgi:hypothetical protein
VSDYGRYRCKVQSRDAVLKFFSIDSRYRRIARFYPALATIKLLLPVAIRLGISLSGWMRPAAG